MTHATNHNHDNNHHHLLSTTVARQATPTNHFGVTTMITRTSRFFAVAALAAGCTGTTFACPGGEHTIPEMVGQADLVFRGVVADIQYRLSDPGGPEMTQVPYTFVTYFVDDVIQGQIQGKTVTLRFIGGWDEQSMNFMSSSITPMFDLGDEDILMVQGNNESMSPLVCATRGRLRVIDGQVFTETGRSITVDDNGKMTTGPRHLLEEVLTTSINNGMMVMESKVGPDVVVGPANSVSADSVVNRLRKIELDGKPALFVNSNPLLAVAAPDMTAAAPPDAKPGEAQPNEEQHEEARRDRQVQKANEVPVKK